MGLAESIMQSGSIASAATKIIPAMRVLLPPIEKVALKLMALCNLNRTVHLPTYNKLIGEKALERGKKLGVV